jgi:hypothetical protein
MKIMKRNIYTLVLLCSVFGFSATFAQKNVGIGTTTPDNSAVLDINSSEKGLLIPRMSLQQRNAINNPADGLMVYQTGEQGGFYFFEGKTNEWKPITEAKAVAGIDGDWTLQGNAASAGDFIGTTNDQPLTFRVNLFRVGYIDNSGYSNFFLGKQSGINTVNTGSIFGLDGGGFNVSMGEQALWQNTTGAFNVAYGFRALRFNTTGYFNTALGREPLTNNTTGFENTALGPYSLYSNTVGNLNFGIGKRALFNNIDGHNNLAIGVEAGYSNTSGSRNIFMGFKAGYLETGSDKLYIANSQTSTPLIYGDFSAKYVSIGDVPASDAKRKDAAAAGYNLLVKGGILTEKVKVALVSTTDWADYVFEDSYKLMPLSEVESYTKINKHLPNVPSTEEMVANGLDVAATNKMLMEKIEELTLYVIDLNKEIEKLKSVK